MIGLVGRSIDQSIKPRRVFSFGISFSFFPLVKFASLFSYSLIDLVVWMELRDRGYHWGGGGREMLSGAKEKGRKFEKKNIL